MLSHHARPVTRHARQVLIAAVVVLIVFVFLGAHVFARLESQGFSDPNSGSSRAASVLNSKFPEQLNLVLLVTDRDGETVDAPRVAGAGRDLLQRLSQQPGVSALASWLTTKTPELRSHDGLQALVVAHVGATGATTADDNAQTVISALSGGTTTLQVAVGGSIGITHDIETQVGQDLAHAESIAVPITFILLLVAFASGWRRRCPWPSASWPSLGASPNCSW